MQFQQINLSLLTEEEGADSYSFEGIPLGRSVDKKTDSESYQTSVEIYRTEEGLFIIYVSYREKDGEINFADVASTDSLDLGSVRAALKEADIYPGTFYSEAIYHSFNSLKKLE
ncbi:hypothetical protein KGY71_07275 [Candidatus Bipolaricaulota bacterium]|nr:hypothetical protein [Candidatus Bipolaricaulota bacterium]